MNKKEARKKSKEERQKLSFEQVDEKSLAIANQLVQMDIWNKNYYHLFLPIEEQKEVNSEYILNILQAKDKEIVISKSDFATTSMTHYLLTDNTKIKKNVYNIPEPITGKIISNDLIDTVITPLIICDLNGYRVGYGKGFYDNFFNSCKPTVKRFGIGYFSPIKKIENVDRGKKFSAGRK